MSTDIVTQSSSTLTQSADLLPMSFGLAMSRRGIVGLDIATITFAEWREVVEQISRVGDAEKWAIGDAIAFGETKYGGKYDVVMSITGLEYQSLADRTMVARRFQFSRRRENCPWWAHREIVSLSDPEQDAALDLFVARRDSGRPMRRADVRQLVSERRPGAPGASVAGSENSPLLAAPTDAQTGEQAEHPPISDSTTPIASAALLAQSTSTNIRHASENTLPARDAADGAMFTDAPPPAAVPMGSAADAMETRSPSAETPLYTDWVETCETLYHYRDFAGNSATGNAKIVFLPKSPKPYRLIIDGNQRGDFLTKDRAKDVAEGIIRENVEGGGGNAAIAAGKAAL